MSLKNSIFGELWYRFRKPWCTSFTINFVFYVVLIGGLGVFSSIIKCINESGDKWQITESIITYSLAIAIPSIVPILLSFNDTKYKSSLVQLSPIICLVIPAALTLLSYTYKISWPAYACTIMAWIIWVISQYKNVFLNDETYADYLEKNAKNNHGKNW